MSRLVSCLLTVVAASAANPYVETFVSEVCPDSVNPWIELHQAPFDGYQPISLVGWQIVTSTSTCTLDCILQPGEYLVIDSIALAEGLVGWGTLRLDPAGDSVVLVESLGHEEVVYPRSPTGQGRAPAPPPGGSIAFWNYDDYEDQSMNWYIDSTPTPGWLNDDYSVIMGWVTGSGGVVLDEVVVRASGLSGDCHDGLYQQAGYGIGGLGPGVYEVTATAWHQGHTYRATYPESVVVGYSSTVSPIDLVVTLTGVAEPRPGLRLPPRLRVAGRTVRLSVDGRAPVTLELYDGLGRRAALLYVGILSGGEHRFELPAQLTPGVYFARARSGEYQADSKVLAW